MAEQVAENGSSRGEFLARGAGIAGLAVGAGMWAGGMASAASAAAPADVRSYAAGHFQLELDGILIGLLKSFDGGAITGEVIEEETEPGQLIAKKHIGNIKYEDFAVQVPVSSNKELYSWISNVWSGEPVRKSGQIVLADHDYNAKRAVQFERALLTEVRIPACDGGSKDAGYLGIEFSPETIENVKASGKVKLPPKSQKQWVPSNFRFSLGDLPCKRVSKIDSFTIKQAIITEHNGDTREYEKEPGKLEFPNLKVTFPEVDLPKWNTWFESMVLKGNMEDELTGKLELLGPSLKSALCTIDMFGVGIYRLAFNNAPADGDAVRRVTAELYVERMEIKLGGG